ncbi:MAG: hypothetical protein Q8O88_03100 [bacterium]|nr:hypothetical protein [bacterium]
MNKTPFIIAGTVATIAIVLVASGSLVINQLPVNKVVKFTAKKSMGADNVVELASGAFGNLFGTVASDSRERQATPTLGAAEGMSASPATGAKMGFGGGGGVSMAPQADSSETNAVAVEGRMMMPYYEYTYNFKYIGDDIEISEAQMPVYRLALDETIGRTIASSVSDAGISFIDLIKFKNLSVTSMNMQQKDGFNIYFNLEQGRVSMDKNQSYVFAEPMMLKCDAPDCGYQEKTFTALPDNQLIAIANDFLSNYGITRSIYGTPVVDNYWKKYQSESSYVPQMQAVIYPLSFDGMNVFESGGYLNGMRVTVDAENMSVSNVNEIFNPFFEKSNYEIETDFARILKVAERGGINMYFYGAKEDSEVLELGTPEYVYMHQYDYSSNDGRSRELYIPALRFSILNAKDKNIYQDSIVVPIAKEILDKYINEESGGIIPRPLPMMTEGSSGEGAAGVSSSGEATVVDMMIAQ